MPAPDPVAPCAAATVVPDEERFAAAVAGLLFASGQTTEGLRITVARLGQACGTSFRLVTAWGSLTLLSDRLPFGVTVLAVPTGVDMGRVRAAEGVAGRVTAATATAAQSLPALEQIGRLPPVGLARFAGMAAAGAAALAVIFGAADLVTLALIAASAGLGACLRRVASRLSTNILLQPFLAAGLAGLIAGSANALGLGGSGQLIAACPCMVLVPGPHFLNGAIDLVRARIALGAARLCFAGLVVVAICAGLLLGLAATGASLARGGPAPDVPFTLDACAAGVAVAAYGSFFNMPWRTLPIPVGVGMLAHALRWQLLAHGTSVQGGALAACLLVGVVMTPVSARLLLPFAALAFAAVVSLIPGVFLFQAAAQAVALIGPAPADPMALLLGLVTDGTMAALTLMAMTFGLIVPKLWLDFAAKT